MVDAFSTTEDDTPMGTTTQPPASNTGLTLEKLMQQVKALGRDHGAGAVSLPRLALRVCDAAAKGVINSGDIDPKTGLDDTARIYAAYIESSGKKAEVGQLNGATAKFANTGGDKVNASKLRQFTKLGEDSKLDGPELLERAMSVHGEAMKTEAKSVKPLYQGMLDVARAALKAMADGERHLTDEEIRNIVVKQGPKAKALEDVWDSIQSSVRKLVAGDRPDGLQDSSPGAEAVLKALQKHVGSV